MKVSFYLGKTYQEQQRPKSFVCLLVGLVWFGIAVVWINLCLEFVYFLLLMFRPCIGCSDVLPFYGWQPSVAILMVHKLPNLLNSSSL